MRRTTEGRCHCGDVRFTCTIDTARPTIRCNCSICAAQRYWHTDVPIADLTLHQGAASLAQYRFGGRHVGIASAGAAGSSPSASSAQSTP